MNRPATFTTTILTALISGCTATNAPSVSGSSIPTLQRINDTAQRCWMKSGDEAFRPYRIVPELDTRTGKPRILMLRAGRTAGLPELVIELSGSQIDAYGPIQNTALAGRINRDIVRWGNGDASC
ncbi:hypothetical protein [Notoacmeibacter sp. MSK16QG-6]|uniref:hypothetical protein n=1 Tax=Notoacmeibacter sp. MSK16QG-6 TaxID=2957982 RepID=UPI00209F48A3|nr:hypothetical protein [Notoacmeibacter sp. MSK16QG-6]MCP1199452.1 hypothetical protein [Notoacmeibacter sp. MSK16QG-6]